MAETANHKLATQIAVLEEKMSARHAETESALDRLRVDMADLKTDWKSDMADLRTDLAKRDNRLIFSVLGIMVAGITILGFVLTSAP